MPASSTMQSQQVDKSYASEQHDAITASWQ
jgi:hypothetical protein